MLPGADKFGGFTHAPVPLTSVDVLNVGTSVVQQSVYRNLKHQKQIQPYSQCQQWQMSPERQVLLTPAVVKYDAHNSSAEYTTRTSA